MLILSATKGEQGSKVYYKDYKKVTANMATIGRYLRDYSISSFVYSDGKTPKGEHVAGRRAHEQIIESGNILLVDIDSKYVPVTFEELVEKLEGVSCYIAPSKSWSEEVQKYHIVVEMRDLLPADKADFAHLYKAVCQHIGLDGLYDPAMQTPTQQMAPHFRKDAPEMLLPGDPVDAGLALTNYVAPEGETNGGRGISGNVARDAVFTLSGSGRQMDYEAMLTHAQQVGKERVHCVDGLQHDGRRDTAFVQALDDGRVLYHCSGGRCQKSLVMESNPFSVEADETEVERVEVVQGATVWDDIGRVRDVIMDNPHLRLVYAEGATATLREEAVAFAGVELFAQRGVKRVNDELMSFCGTHWVRLFEDGAALNQFVGELFRSAGFVSMSYNNAKTANVAKMLEKTVPAAEKIEHGNFLNMQNCVLEVSRDAIKKHKHDPKFLFTSTLPYDYSPSALAPTWSNMVAKVMCNRADLVSSFKEALGYLLLRDFNKEKMICFVGEGANGKTTVMDVVKWLVGRDGYASTPIKMLLKDSSEGLYSRTTLAGKLVNITNELTPDSLEADAFKDLITGEDIQARQLYGQPFSLEVVPKQLVAMNTTDRLVKERTHGYMRRLHLIPFDYTIRDSDYDPELKDKLRAELAGILNWCLDGARQVIANNGLSVSSEMDKLLDGVARDANPVQQFLEEHVELFDRAYTQEDHALLTKGEDLISEYREFCNENGYRPMGRNKFYAEVQRLGVLRIVNNVLRVNGRLLKADGFFCTLKDKPFVADGVKVVPFRKAK